MALKFFWRIESADLETSNGDYSANDTLGTSLGNNFTYNTTAARVGTNGGYATGGIQVGRSYSISGIINGAVADNSTAEANVVFSAGYSVQYTAAGSLTIAQGSNTGLRVVGDSSNHIEVEGGGSATLRLAIRSTGYSDKFASLTTALSPNVWYGVVIRVDAPNNKFAIELYNASGGLVEAVERTDLTLGSEMPWFGSGASGIQIGNASVQSEAVYFDNLIISDSYSAPIQNNFLITHYNQYTESSTTTKLKLMVHQSAAGATGVSGVVFNAPTGGAITGTEIGEFTNKSFEASLENNKAVLKVPVADFGGTSLTTSDAPVALVRTSTKTTGIITCSVIEE